MLQGGRGGEKGLMPYYTDKELTAGVFVFLGYILLAGLVLPVVIFRWCKSQFKRVRSRDNGQQ